MTGVVVFAHGSSVEPANARVVETASELARAGGFPLVETAFLELAEPDLAEAVKRLVSRGAKRVVIVPYFLTLGIHLRRDLPGIVAGLRSIYQDVEIETTEPLEGHPALLEALLDRAKTALQHGGSRSESQAD
jgi:sirohydrochlorin ferrochelatase